MRGRRREEPGMARKPLPPSQSRSQVAVVRLTLAEHEHIRGQADAAGLTVSEYLRRWACGYTVPPPPPARAGDAALLLAVNRIGNNVNQLAKATHLDREFVSYWKSVGEELREVLHRIAGADVL